MILGNSLLFSRGSAKGRYQLSAPPCRMVSLKSTSVHSIHLFEFLPTIPKLNVDRAVELLDVTYPTANTAVKSLVEAGVLVEMFGRSRHRSYEYRRHV